MSKKILLRILLLLTLSGVLGSSHLAKADGGTPVPICTDVNRCPIN